MSPALSATIDTTPPTVSAPTFSYADASQSLSYTVSEALATNPSSSDLSLVNTATGAAVNSAARYNSATRTLTYTFPDGALASGAYQPTILAANIKDLAGNAMAANSAGSFSFLQGDINGSGVVDSADFLILSQNFGKTSATYSQGDLNYDHVVNAIDYGILATNFGQSASPAAPAVSQDAQPATVAQVSAAQVEAAPVQSLFGATKISDGDASVL